MEEYWENELLIALKERGHNLESMSPEQAADEFTMWHYGACIGREVLHVHAAAKRIKERARATEQTVQES